MAFEKVGRHARGAGDGYIDKIRLRNWQLENPERAAFCQEFLDRIDYPTFGAMYREEIVRSGGRAEDSNRVDRNDMLPGVESLGNEPNKMDYDAEMNKIRIDTRHSTLGFLFENRHLIESPKKKDRERIVEALVNIIFEIAHEMNHAHGFVDYVEESERTPEGALRKTINVRTGFEHDTYVHEKRGGRHSMREEISMKNWNEAVTEWYAFRQAREYLRRSPFGWRGITISAQDFDKRVPAILSKSGYILYVELIEDLFDAMAAYTGVPRPTIENSFIRGFNTESGRAHFNDALSHLFQDESFRAYMNRNETPAGLTGRQKMYRSARSLIQKYIESHPEFSAHFMEQAYIQKSEADERKYMEGS